jgi:hypothetical protein
MLNEGQSKENKEKNSLPLDQTNASEFISQNYCPSMRQRRFIPVSRTLNQYKSLLSQKNEMFPPELQCFIPIIHLEGERLGMRYYARRIAEAVGESMDRKHDMGKIFGRLIETRCSISVRKTSSWYRQQKTVLYFYF